MEGEGDVLSAHPSTRASSSPARPFFRKTSQRQSRLPGRRLRAIIKELLPPLSFQVTCSLKHLGFTRHCRVVFLRLHEAFVFRNDCNFRKLPVVAPSGGRIDIRTWFSCGEHDFFPKNFLHSCLFRASPARLFTSPRICRAILSGASSSPNRAGDLQKCFPYPSGGG